MEVRKVPPPLPPQLHAYDLLATSCTHPSRAAQKAAQKHKTPDPGVEGSGPRACAIGKRATRTRALDGTESLSWFVAPGAAGVFSQMHFKGSNHMHDFQTISPLVEISRVALVGDRIVAFGGPAWLATEQECRRWFRNGTRFFMYDARGRDLEVYLDERGFLTTVPTWRTSGDSPSMQQILQLPRMVGEGNRPETLTS